MRVLVALVLLITEMALAKKKKDYYQLLGVKRNADDAALKKAYRKVSGPLLFPLTRPRPEQISDTLAHTFPFSACPQTTPGSKSSRQEGAG